MDDQDEYDRLIRLAPSPEQQAEQQRQAEERLAGAEALEREARFEAQRRARLVRDAGWLDD